MLDSVKAMRGVEGGVIRARSGDSGRGLPLVRDEVAETVGRHVGAA